MQRTTEFYKELEKLNYYIIHEEQFSKPSDWESLGIKEDKKTGLYSELFRSPQGELFLLFRGTDLGKGSKEAVKDIVADVNLFLCQYPDQAKSTYDMYKYFAKEYKGESIKLSGYSLGGSLSAILGNALGIESINYAPYGVADFIEPYKDDKIVNFGNEKDIIYNHRAGYHLGKAYVIPDEGVSGLIKHMPNGMGEVSAAYEFSNYSRDDSGLFKTGVAKTGFNDNLLNTKNRVLYRGELPPSSEMDEDLMNIFLDQYYENDGLPDRSELETRYRMDELIYVENYIRSDGTKVSGYYRRHPQK